MRLMTFEEFMQRLKEPKSEGEFIETLKELENKKIVVVLDENATVEYKETETGDHLPVVHGHFHYELTDKDKEE